MGVKVRQQLQSEEKQLKKMSRPLRTDNITTACNYWVKRVHKGDEACPQSPGWKLIKDEHTGVLKCEDRIKGYRSTYLPGGPLPEKLVAHTHTQSGHASWHCNHDGKCEREFVRTTVES